MNDMENTSANEQRELAAILDQYPEIIPDVTKYAQGWRDGRMSAARAQAEKEA